MPILTTLTEWFFAGDWIHRRYTYPEIWRQGVEGKAIAATSVLPFLTCGFFAYMAARLVLHTVPQCPQDGGSSLADRPTASDPYERGVHEASSSVRSVLCSGLVNKARACRACSGLVSAPTLSTQTYPSSTGVVGDGLFIAVVTIHSFNSLDAIRI